MINNYFTNLNVANYIIFGAKNSADSSFAEAHDGKYCRNVQN